MDSFWMKAFGLFAGLMLPALTGILISDVGSNFGRTLGNYSILFIALGVNGVAFYAFSRWRRSARAKQGIEIDPNNLKFFEGAENYFQHASIGGMFLMYNPALHSILRGAWL